MLYVPNTFPPSITAYPLDANGDVAPVRTIAGTHTLLSGRVEAVAFDSHSNLYATTITGCATCIVVFAAGASGNATPIGTTCRTALASDGFEGVAVDRSDNIYVANIDLNTISVYTTNGAGQLTLARTIGGSQTGLVGPSGITLDSSGRLYVVSGQSIEVFAAGASGNVAPVATIAGNQTLLFEPASIALDSAGDIIVGNGAVEIPEGGDTVLTFAAGSSGNVAPVSVIDGSNTQLGGGVVLDVAVDSIGEVFAAQRSEVNVFSPGSNGNVAPIRSIAGPNTDLGLGFGGLLTIH